MSTPGSSPPAQPPMMSPDGKWVWDGQKWIPVAVHESVFPAYSDAAAGATTTGAGAALAETMVSAPVNPFEGSSTPSPFATPPQGTPFAGPPPTSNPFGPMPSPASAPAVVSPPIIQPAGYTAAGATPPWQAWAAGSGDRSRTMKLAAAFVAVALGVILVIYFGLSQLPFLRAGGDQNASGPSPSATTTPQLAVRSDFAVADRYVKTVFAPAMNQVGTPIFQIHEACNGTLSTSCSDALTALNKVLAPALVAFKQGAPVCIAPQVARVLYDLGLINEGVTVGLKAYVDNNKVELHNALGSFTNGDKPLQADIQVVLKAQASCDGQASGP